MRQSLVVDTEYGPVRGKSIQLPNGETRFSVEDDDARSVATSNQTTAEHIRQTAMAAFAKLNTP